MISEEMVIRELLNERIPAIETVVNEIRGKSRENLPSTAQLNHFRNYVMSRNIGEIMAYLERKSEVSGSQKWIRKYYKGKEGTRNKDMMGLSDLLIKSIIDPLNNLSDDVLDESSTLWEIKFDKFFGDTIPGTLKIAPHKNSIIREVLCRIIDVLLGKKEGYQFSYDEKFKIRVFDKQSHPDREILDISSIKCKELAFGGRVLLCDPQLKIPLRLEKDEGRTYYIAEDRKLDIHVFAADRKTLLEELAEQLFFMWDTYALGNPDALTDDAQQLGEILRKRFREIK